KPEIVGKACVHGRQHRQSFEVFDALTPRNAVPERTYHRACRSPPDETQYGAVKPVVRNSQKIDIVSKAADEFVSGGRCGNLHEWQTGSEYPIAKRRDVNIKLRRQSILVGLSL